MKQTNQPLDLRILESLFIKQLQPTLNKDTSAFRLNIVC